MSSNTSQSLCLIHRCRDHFHFVTGRGRGGVSWPIWSISRGMLMVEFTKEKMCETRREKKVVEGLRSEIIGMRRERRRDIFGRFQSTFLSLNPEPWEDGDIAQDWSKFCRGIADDFGIVVYITGRATYLSLGSCDFINRSVTDSQKAMFITFGKLEKKKSQRSSQPA